MLPELPALRLEIDEHHQHKDVYEHTLQVLERAIALEQDGPDLVLRLAALLHDIGKPRTRRKEPGGGVSFHHHEVVGASMASKRLTALRYPKDVVAAVVLLTELHLRFHGYRVGGGQGRAWAVGGQGVGGAGRGCRGGRAGQRLDRQRSAPLRHRRRPPARAAARAGALGLHDAQPPPGGGAGRGLRRPRGADRRARRAGGAAAASGPTSTARRSWSCCSCRRDRWSGQAYSHLLEVRMERGPLPREQAEQELRAWARERGIDVPDAVARGCSAARG